MDSQELARLSGVPVEEAQEALDELVKEGLLEMSSFQDQEKFSLNRERFKVAKVVTLDDGTIVELFDRSEVFGTSTSSFDQEK